MAKRTCSVDGCERVHNARGWCAKHYMRWYNQLAEPPARPTAYDRFLAGVDTSGGPDACHPWTGNRSPRGYGLFWTEGRTWRVHRWLLGHLRGEHLARDEFACHACDNPPCCNERHLYIGTPAQNSADMVRRGRAINVLAQRMQAKTHCARGHPYDEENTYRRPSRPSVRHCWTCIKTRWSHS